MIMADFKLKQSYYKSPTPEAFRKIGDAILIAGPMIQGAVMGLPLSDSSKIWVNFGITILCALGKISTNFFIEAQPNCPVQPVDPTVPSSPQD